MQVDALAIRLRPRSPLEAADFGVRLCQSAARSVSACYVLAAVPVALGFVYVQRFLITGLTAGAVKG